VYIRDSGVEIHLNLIEGEGEEEELVEVVSPKVYSTEFSVVIYFGWILVHYVAPYLWLIPIFYFSFRYSEWDFSWLASTIKKGATPSKRPRPSSQSPSEKDIMSRFFNGMIAVKGGRGFINYIKYIVYIIRGSVTASQMRSITVVIKKLALIRKSQGNRGLVIFTKALTVILMQSVAKHKIVSTRPLGCAVSRTTVGLPRIIPAIHRDIIRRGGPMADFLVRFYMSIFSIYRAISFRPTLKISTIIKPGVAIPESLYKEFQAAIQGFFSAVKVSPVDFKSSLVDKLEFSNLSKSSPSLTGVFPSKKTKGYSPSGRVIWHSPTKGLIRSSSSPLGIIMAAYAWTDPSNSYIFLQLQRYVKSFRSGNLLPSSEAQVSPQHDFIRLLVAIGNGVRYLLSIKNEVLFLSSWFFTNYNWAKLEHLTPLGKLGFKVEAAGKVRVFAMVDCWTQWALAPLHNALFGILKKIPQDGLYDQLKPSKKLLKKSVVKHLFSYDLSAATDRLPISIQRQIISFLLGNEIARCWADILVGRDYSLGNVGKSKDFYVPKDIPTTSVRYAVGQPMGALSSWAMLALTHHIIVYMAAKRAGYRFGSFKDYALLGDDIVIGQKSVAKAYYSIMTELGVEIGLFKSLISPNGHLEFAKRFLSKTADLSPVPFKELYCMKHNLAEMIEAARKYSLSYISLARVMGYGFKVLGKLNNSPIPRNISMKLRILSLTFYSPLADIVEWPLASWLALDRLWWTNEKPPLASKKFWQRFTRFSLVEINKIRKECTVTELFAKWGFKKHLNEPNKLHNLSIRQITEDKTGILRNCLSRGGFGWLPIDHLINEWFNLDKFRYDVLVQPLAIIYSSVLSHTMLGWVMLLQQHLTSALVVKSSYTSDPENFKVFFESRSTWALLAKPRKPSESPKVLTRTKEMNLMISTFRKARMLRRFFR
jgi:hypothetical protein